MPQLDAFAGLPLHYATDDGVPFVDWAPPALTEQEADARYEAGERFAVLGGEPATPRAALMLDRGNGRAVLTTTGPTRTLVFGGTTMLRLTGARWSTETDELVAERGSGGLLRVSRRPIGVPVWVQELLAARAPREADSERWPEFGDWAGLSRIAREPGEDWWDPGVLDLIDADGWLLEEFGQLDLANRWRDLAQRYDAPRAYGLPPPVQAKLAEPRGWLPRGRRWRRSAEVGGALVLTDASFVAGAGGGSEVTVTVSRDEVEVSLPLPAATARLEASSIGRIRSPAQPRPSASAQVGVVAVLDLATEVHEAVVTAVRDGALPPWQRLSAAAEG